MAIAEESECMVKDTAHKLRVVITAVSASTQQFGKNKQNNKEISCSKYEKVKYLKKFPAHGIKNIFKVKKSAQIIKSLGKEISCSRY